MEEQGLKVVVKRTQCDYSLSFKLSVIEEVESGSMTYKQAQQKLRPKPFGSLGLEQTPYLPKQMSRLLHK